MNRNKILLNIGLTIILILLAVLVFKTSDTTTKFFITGLVKEQQIDSKKLYDQTIVDTYDPEPNWQPQEEIGTANEPFISGTAGFLIDINSGNIVFSKNPNEKLPIASLTKIMTAVVALEHKKLGEKIYVSQEADEVGENSMNLDYGEIYSLEELMYGLILNSGNDAAYAIAIGVAGDKSRFVDWMNIKAKELGLTDSVFTDPSGLDDGNMSSVADLTKLTRYALKNPTFRKIVATLQYEISDTNDHKYIYLENQTNLLSSYPGVAGVKTGYTEVAGLCLVTYASNDGKELVGAVLGSGDRKGDMILMLDHGFNTLGVNVVHNLW
ncbi:D-alanyl-D-alanine carboxypeptidase [candidate division WWE3 bacterium]|nr:D-alanyl-D-alanine carboxypeptidase [candidate division WWE3 bacterium]